MIGTFKLKADATAAGGYALWNPNRNAGQDGIAAAAAAPARYAEFTVFAEAGRPYQSWLRRRAERNDPNNDSVHVQFTGVAAARIGSVSSLVVNLEEAAGAGIAAWAGRTPAMASACWVRRLRSSAPGRRPFSFSRGKMV